MKENKLFVWSLNQQVKELMMRRLLYSHLSFLFLLSIKRNFHSNIPLNFINHESTKSYFFRYSQKISKISYKEMKNDFFLIWCHNKTAWSIDIWASLINFQWNSTLKSINAKSIETKNLLFIHFLYLFRTFAPKIAIL